MDDFDRDQPGRGDDSSSRRRERADRPTRRDEPSRGRPGDRQDSASRDDFQAGERDSRSRSSRSGPREPIDADTGDIRNPRRSEPPRDSERPPRYSDRFKRATELPTEEQDSRSYQSARDPYDRLRTTARRQPRQVEPDPYDDDEYGDEDRSYGARAAGYDRRPERRQSTRAAQAQFRSVGATLANPSPEMRPLLLHGILAAASLIVLSLLIAIRSGSAPAWIPLHLDAEGTPTLFGTKSAVWRLPVFALFATIMALGLGWWLRIREGFAVQFLAVGTLMIHGIVWVGVITLLW